MRFTRRLLMICTLLFCVGLTAGDKDKPLTRDNGAPVGDNQNSKTAGPGGPVLLEDMHLVEKLARFNRERIPERVVHARGTGAHGVFELKKDMGRYTYADMFQGVGKQTDVFVRFSTVIHSKGSPETLRDPRGFAVKFYTNQGNWDLVGNNLPVFFIRDAIKFPDMVHSLKPSPVTNRQDPNRFFDFFSHIPESTHMLTLVYSDLGTPASYRTMDGNGVHAYKFVNQNGEFVYVKFRWKTHQGVKNLSAVEASEVQAGNFNHLTQDLYDAIAAGDFPKWDLMIQVLEPSRLNDFDYNPLDATKIWPEIPEVHVGTMTLNRVPDNFYLATEQSAFSPGVMVPGIEPSEDRLLQGRVFAYGDAHRYRLGANHQQLPINAAKSAVRSFNQNGALNMARTNSDLNYQPSRSNANLTDQPAFRHSRLALSGTTQQQPITKTLNFKQAGDAYRGFSKQEQDNLIKNFSGDLKQVKSHEIKKIIVGFLYQADPVYGRRMAKAVGVDLAEIKAAAH